MCLETKVLSGLANAHFYLVGGLIFYDKYFRHGIMSISFYIFRNNGK